MSDNEARARTVANQIAERFGLVDSICAKNGRIGACEKAAFGDCDCPKAMYPDDEKVVSDFITAALQAAEDRGRAAGRAQSDRLLDWCHMRLRPVYRSLFEKYRANPLPPRDPNEPPLVLSEAAISARITALSADTPANRGEG